MTRDSETNGGQQWQQPMEGRPNTDEVRLEEQAVNKLKVSGCGVVMFDEDLGLKVMPRRRETRLIDSRDPREYIRT